MYEEVREKDCRTLLWYLICSLVLLTIPDMEEDGKSSERESLWLECDDEKIKLVSAAEVSDMMRTTIITPYLLFYSRL